MSLEINRAHSPWVYRISPDNPRLIERKPNKARARWMMYRLCTTEQVARDALLKLERKAGAHE